MGYIRENIELKAVNAGSGRGQCRMELWEEASAGYRYKLRLSARNLMAGETYPVSLISLRPEAVLPMRRYLLGRVVGGPDGSLDMSLRGCIEREEPETHSPMNFAVVVLEHEDSPLQGFRREPVEWRVQPEAAPPDAEPETKVELKSEPKPEPPKKADSWAGELFRQYRTVHPFPGDGRRWLRLRPDDIALLPSELQSLRQCPFAMRGCCRYGHLILGEPTGEGGGYTVGIPYRYLPALAGEAGTQHFTTFRSIRGGEAGYGEYGYWLREFGTKEKEDRCIRR